MCATSIKRLKCWNCVTVGQGSYIRNPNDKNRMSFYCNSCIQKKNLEEYIVEESFGRRPVSSTFNM